LAQVGTNRDWKAIRTTVFNGNVLALRADGTLWTWGDFGFLANGIWFNTNLPSPTQLCVESNWMGLGDGLWSGARNQAGEWWSFYPFRSLPGAKVPVAAIGQLASSNSAMAALGPVFNTKWSFGMYDIQPGGTMTVKPLLSWPASAPSLTPTIRFGQRSDWISAWGGAGTLLGLSSDGSLWTWGLDFRQRRHYSLGERLDLAKTAIADALGATPRRGQYDEWGGYQPQKEPRLLLRMVVTNTAEGNSPSTLRPRP
jgi:alpha-tubulin suppressor-like RCC1 family protein